MLKPLGCGWAAVCMDIVRVVDGELRKVLMLYGTLLLRSQAVQPQALPTLVYTVVRHACLNPVRLMFSCSSPALVYIRYSTICKVSYFPEAVSNKSGKPLGPSALLIASPESTCQAENGGGVLEQSLIGSPTFFGWVMQRNSQQASEVCRAGQAP